MTIENVDIIFEKLAEDLDITPTLLKKAKERYESVGRWINKDGSNLNKLQVEVEISLQGSAKLGTITKPIEKDDEYDIDAVCELKNLSKKTVTQEQVKKAFGEDIKNYAKANSMNKAPKDGKRCWTLNYKDEANFHMDFLPAIPDGNNFGIILESREFSKGDYFDTTIAITDKTSPFYNEISDEWNVSNPKGYFQWFKDKMSERYKFQRQYIAESRGISIEEVPEYEIKTTLQKAIQILKRHRNIYFKENSEYSVASVIITTLAARAYNGNSSLAKTLSHLTLTMENYITSDFEGYKVVNPVNPLENFTDKWNIDDKFVCAFKGWIKEVKEDIKNIIELNNNIFEDEKILEGYKNKFGETSINIAYGKGFMEYEKQTNKKAGAIASSIAIPTIVKPYGGGSL